MSVLSYLSVPLIVFLVFVVPLWLTFHYITKWKRMKQDRAQTDGTAANPQELRRLRETAARLEERIRSLETILDKESPDWRQHQ